MIVALSNDPASVDSTIGAYRAIKEGQRGISTYSWIVDTLRSHPGSESIVITGPGAAAVVTIAGGSAVLHSLQGEAEPAAEIIAAARERYANVIFRGLALPGDRQTKNLFEEARMPAQLLMH